MRSGFPGRGERKSFWELPSNVDGMEEPHAVKIVVYSFPGTLVTEPVALSYGLGAVVVPVAENYFHPGRIPWTPTFGGTDQQSPASREEPN